MIKSNELREGNWIKYHHGIFKVEPLTIFNISNEPQFYEPIELTEDIISKVKYVKISFTSDPQGVEVSKLYEINSFKIHQPDEDNNYFILCLDDYIIEIKYLHQLQNLYFALNGKELEINL